MTFFNSLIKNEEINEKEKILLIEKLWFNLKKWYILHKRYPRFNDYIKDKINLKEKIVFDTELINKDRNTAIYNTLKKHCWYWELFKYDNATYFTYKFINRLWITAEYLNNTIHEIREKFRDKWYFSVKNIREVVDINKLENLEFGDKFIENIISVWEWINTLKIGERKIFIIDDTAQRIFYFIDYKMESYKAISLERFTENIRNLIYY